MRRKTNSKSIHSVIAISTFLLLLIIFAPDIPAEEQLKIDTEEVFVVFERDLFKVSVYVESDSAVDYLTDVVIVFNNTLYQITEESENAEIFLEAPSVETDKTFNITATKTGYTPGILQITVKNKPSLEIIPDDFIFTAGEEFYITVIEKETNTPVKDVTVYIYNSDGTEKTNEDGNAFLKAPENFEEITIHANKEGYSSDKVTVQIKKVNNLFLTIIYDRYFLIFACGIILFFAIVFVNLRQKKSIYNRAKEISNQRVIEKYEPEIGTFDHPKRKKFELEGFSGPPLRVSQDEDGKVEEIRISRSHKDKDVVDVRSKDKDNEETNKKRKTSESDWFEGTDELKYEIGKLTGEIDEEGMDKWFEGVEGLKKKVDEKIKKKKSEEEK